MKFPVAMMTWFHTIRILIPLLAGVALVLAVISAISTFLFVRSVKTTMATIVDSTTTVSDEGETAHKPTFAFVVAGRDYTVTSESFVSPSPGPIGSRVAVLYDPRNPRNARIDSFVYTRLIPFVLTCLAVVFGLLHFAIAWARQRIRYIPQTDG